MTGKLFARTLKQNPEVRKDFRELVEQQIATFLERLENQIEDTRFHQGKIKGLRLLLETVEELSMVEDGDGAADKPATR